MAAVGDARKRLTDDEWAADVEHIGRLADIIHRAIEPVGAEGAPKCPEDDKGFVGCFAAATAILASDWLAEIKAQS